MATAAIKISGVPGSDDDLQCGNLITLSNNNDAGVITWLWEVLSNPAGSAIALATPVAATTTCTPDLEGSYLFKLTVNAAIAGEDDDQVVGAVKQVRMRFRIPAPGETDEVSATEGWAAARNNDLGLLDDIVTNGAVHVGLIEVAETPPDAVSWKRGDIVYLATYIDINPSATTELVPVWRKPPTPLVVSGVYGVVHSDTDGNTIFDQSVTNIPGIATGRGVNVVIDGYIKGETGKLDFTDITYYPNGASIGDPIYLTGELHLGQQQHTNICDEFGSSTFQGGSANDFSIRAERSVLLGYAVEIAGTGAILVKNSSQKERRTGPVRVDNGIVAHSLRLGGTTSQDGHYVGTIPFNSSPGSIEVECYDPSHAASFQKYDIVALRLEDPLDPNVRDDVLAAYLADPNNIDEHSFLGMITNKGNTPNSGHTMKATIFGIVQGCIVALPGGTTDGEVLYLDPSIPGNMARRIVVSLSANSTPHIPVARVHSTTLHSGTVFINGGRLTDDESLARFGVQEAKATPFTANPYSPIIAVELGGILANTAITLPIAATAQWGFCYFIQDTDGEVRTGPYSITIDEAGGANINGAATLVLDTFDYQSVMLFSDGTNWFANTKPSDDYIGYLALAGNATPGDIPDGQWARVKNTGNTTYWIAMNDGGTIYEVQLT